MERSSMAGVEMRLMFLPYSLEKLWQSRSVVDADTEKEESQEEDDEDEDNEDEV